MGRERGERERVKGRVRESEGVKRDREGERVRERGRER
jgi:hypothetical protein